ncbi:hypothetical protein CO038_01585 [Candidatus Pacearchaeota archaeon CG_4_9_14_0_2_um_filter_39_13]|nr:hypothetical protein [Candidatus Pacearchaeota archaeon]OIO42450.1 MAG: hypothetical protein AUJ64_04025 [Candidatus Pacearchaeota archaeon CG1_02_39_14]PJC44823.1 MAG: hypothetical protein CO038_01585 [Candidatus Pacearchaeota archaeon CG_4_9_14_0_2_um_filter_39_13]
MNIEREFRNNLLKRKEIELEVESESNSGYEGIRKIIVEKFGSDGSLVVVKKLAGNFGSNKFHASVFIYDSQEAIGKTEIKKKEKKK